MARAEQPPLIHLDTHVVVWLYAGQVDRLSRQATTLVEQGRLRTSPMAELELQYLHEIGRLAVDAASVLIALRNDIGLASSDALFSAVTSKACTFAWTRDPFDRLIAADAVVSGARLVTRDRRLLKHLDESVW